ncbi:hypothetical protein ACWEGE_05905 [Amycolatopsis sp. NPDC004747]
MSWLHHVTEEEIAAAQLRLVSDENLGRSSPAVVYRLAEMLPGDLLELPGDPRFEGTEALGSPGEAQRLQESDVRQGSWNETVQRYAEDVTQFQAALLGHRLMPAAEEPWLPSEDEGPAALW